MIRVVINAKEFWNRVDTLRKGTLADMAEYTGISLATIRTLRCEGKTPNLNDTYLIAEYLGSSVDFLTGKDFFGAYAYKEKKLVESYREADVIGKVCVDRILGIDDGKKYTT